MANEKKMTAKDWKRALRTLRGAHYEVLPIATATLADYRDGCQEGTAPTMEEAFIQACMTMSGACRAERDAASDDETRAALLRVAALALVALTFDELNRGEDACEATAKRLTPTGYLKSRARKKTAKE